MSRLSPQHLTPESSLLNRMVETLLKLYLAAIAEHVLAASEVPLGLGLKSGSLTAES